MNILPTRTIKKFGISFLRMESVGNGGKRTKGFPAALTASMRAIRIGVTGKLGSGKSLLIKAMEEHGMFAIRSDDLARDMMERDPALRAKLTQILGPQAYINGTLDRKFVASKIFSDRTVRKQVEAVV